MNAKFPFDPAKSKIFYGWFIIGLGTIGILMSVPGQTIGVSTFTDSLLEALQISRDELSFAYMCGTIMSSLLLTQGGRKYDMYGVRPIAIFASIFLALVLVYLSYIDYILQFFIDLGIGRNKVLIFFLLFIGFSSLRFSGQGMLTLASRTMMMKWFDQRRGFATGFSNVFIALGFSSSPLVIDWLIQNFGWREAWQFMALILLFVFPIIVFIFFRDSPTDSGLLPDGFSQKTIKSKKKANFLIKKDFTLSEAKKTYTYWVFALTLAWQGMYITGFTFHVISIFNVNGMDREMALNIFQFSSIIAVVITLSFSWISDFISLKYLLMIKMSGAFMATLGIVFLGESPISYYAIIVGNGFLMGLFGVISTVSWPRFFGKKNLGAISGQTMTFIVFGSALGPMIFSSSLTWTGDYAIAGLFCFILIFILFLCSLKADNPQDTIE